jgi:hypothetical protein
MVHDSRGSKMMGLSFIFPNGQRLVLKEKKIGLSGFIYVRV